ncbi:hypothetical protein GCM10023322_70960 [Rugosimonospora acidiphila]|uniref:GPP34 family phosphoprotein n=2 Tax=Rugosimonospora acidiphila TaxID=556531 RepID=A0ABP9SN52_9ACTN
MRHPPRGIRAAYLARLAAQGIVRRRSTRLGRERWDIIRAVARADLCARIEAIVTSDKPLSMDDATLAALIYAAGLDAVVYPGLAGWPRRQRLEHIARGTWPAPTVERAPAAAGSPSPTNVVADGTIQGANDQVDLDVTRATIDAVVRDSMRFIMDAATHAVSVAEHHGHSGHGGISHGGGGHHGH